MTNFVKNIIITGLIILIGWMGINYWCVNRENIKLLEKNQGLLANNAKLTDDLNARIKIDTKKNIVYITVRDEEGKPKTKITELPKESVVDVKVTKDDKEIIIDKPWIVFPLSLNLSAQFSDNIRPTIGLRYIRIDKFSSSLNINTESASISLERDINDFFPMFNNSYLGIFYGNNGFGVCLGASL